MYVCICNAIRESEFRSAARRCHGSGVEAIFGCLGCTPECRQCFEEAEEIIADELASAGMGIAAAA